MVGSSKAATLAWVGAFVIACAMAGTPTTAIADECTDPQVATELAAGTPIGDSLSSSSSVDVFVFEVTEADTLVTVTLTDPYERLYPYLDSSCEIDYGGTGRHMDGGNWDRVANSWVVSFDSEEHVGDYYVTVTGDSQNTTYPASYVVGVELED